MTPTTYPEDPLAKFPLGQIVYTPGAVAAVSQTYIWKCILERHARGDWGCCPPEDQASNDISLVEGGRVMSSYPIDPAKPCKGHGENTLWIITEADRSVTTALLPEEY